MIHHNKINSSLLLQKIRSGELVFGGNRTLRIYGRLDCLSGKRMKRGNRVFFSSEHEALYYGYRPCGHCMKTKYAEWKMSN